MLEGGEVPRYVPNWWNPYAPNVGQKDPLKKQRLLIIIKIIVAVLTLLGGAVLALCINVFAPSGSHRPVQHAIHDQQKNNTNSTPNPHGKAGFEPLIRILGTTKLNSKTVPPQKTTVARKYIIITTKKSKRRN